MPFPPIHLPRMGAKSESAGRARSGRASDRMLLLHACTARSVDTGADLRLAQWAHNEAPALESGQVPDELSQVCG